MVCANSGSVAPKGVSVAASTASTVTGELNQLVIEFTNVSSGSLGVTGSYVIYGHLNA